MRKLFLFLCLSLSALIAISQNYQKVNITQNFDSPQQIESIDFDNDGYEDLITCGISDLFWFKNDGNGAFTRISLVDSIDFFRSFSVFDWEGDGDNDIAFTSYNYYGASQVSWLENDGASNFTLHVVTTAVGEPFHVKVFDIDNDNDQDFLVSESDNDQLFWFENDGLGNFTNIDTIGSNVNQFEIADLDGDNDWDIIYGKAYNGISISSVRCLQNDGLNNFSMITLKSGFNIIAQIKVEDVNNDGYFDIVVADSNADKLVWLRNSWTYTFPTSLNIKTSWDGAYRFDIKDINGDNKMDIIAGSNASDELYLFRGISSGSSFYFHSGVEIYDELNYVSGIAIGDFDGQTDLDFAHIDYYNSQLSTWVNDGSQNFAQQNLAFKFDSPRGFDMKDIDGDGDKDVAAASNDGDFIAWFENKGGDIFQEHELITNYEEPYAVKIVDLDEDGDNDIIAASNDDDRITWFKNDGSNNFTTIHISTAINGPRDFWVEDFDTDGDLDIAVIGYATPFSSGNTGAWWYKNDGSENFTMLEISDNIEGGRSMRAGDINGDTLIDLVISSYYYGDEMFIAVNNGNGFNTISVATIKCEDFELVDFDNDNDLDILAVDFDEDSLYFYENEGAYQFERHTLGYKYRLYSIDPVDYDHDGDIDIVYGTGYSGSTNGSIYEVGLYRNNGSGVLTAELWEDNLGTIKPINVYDYEDDGDYDVVVGFDYGDRITMYKSLELDCHLNVDITALGNTSFCPGGMVQLNANSLDTGISYQWFNDGDSIISAVSDSLIVSSSGIFRVSVNDGTCSSYSNVINATEVVNDTTINQYAICDGDSIEIGGSYYSTAGTYHVNLIDQYTCDSVVSNIITLNPTFLIELSESLCWGTSYNFNGNLLSEPGVYTNQFVNTQGCDSTERLTLTFLNNDTTFLADAICEGESYLFDGANLTQAGTYSQLLSNQDGCDSLLILDLTVNSIDTSVVLESICEGDAFNFLGTPLTVEGTYYHTLQSQQNCDSIIQLELIILPIDTTYLTEAICEGTSFDFFGNSINIAGVYTHVLSNQFMCDSVLVLNLNILPVDTSQQFISRCDGELYDFYGTNVTQSGTYYYTTTSSLACDSVIQLSAVFLPNDSTFISVDICENSSYDFFGNQLNTAGTYSHVLQNQNTCDSTIILELNVNTLDSVQIYASVCENDSFEFFGNYLSAAGMYYHTLTNQFNCDSVIELELSLLQTYETFIAGSFCENDSFIFLGTALDQPGIYTELLNSSLGCDSIVTLDLSMNLIDSVYLNESICEGDTFYFDSTPFTEDVVYHSTQTNQLGCDSVITLNLFVSEYPIVDLGPDTTIYNNQELTLDAVNGFNQYLWQDGSAISVFHIDGSTVGLGTQAYYVEVTNVYQCSSSDTILVTVLENVGVDQSIALTDIKVYPNPAVDQLVVETDGQMLPYTLRLFSESGRLIQELVVNEANAELNLKQQAEGMYFLQFNFNGHIKTVPFIKVNK